MKISEFNDKDIGQDMGRLLHFDKGKLRNIATIPDFEKKLAVSALAGAIRYLEVRFCLYIDESKLQSQMTNAILSIVAIRRLSPKPVSYAPF